MGSSDSFTNFKFRIYEFFYEYLLIFFSTGKLRNFFFFFFLNCSKLEKFVDNWGNKLVKKSDEFVTCVPNKRGGTIIYLKRLQTTFMLTMKEPMSSSDSFTNLETENVYLFLCTVNVNNTIFRRFVVSKYL